LNIITTGNSHKDSEVVALHCIYRRIITRSYV